MIALIIAAVLVGGQADPPQDGWFEFFTSPDGTVGHVADAVPLAHVYWFRQRGAGIDHVSLVQVSCTGDFRYRELWTRQDVSGVEFESVPRDGQWQIANPDNPADLMGSLIWSVCPIEEAS